MVSDPVHDPLRDLFKKAWDATSGDPDAAKRMFGQFIRMTPESLRDFHHLIEDYAGNRLVEEMRAVDAESDPNRRRLPDGTEW